MERVRRGTYRDRRGPLGDEHDRRSDCALTRGICCFARSDIARYEGSGTKNSLIKSLGETRSAPRLSTGIGR